MVGFSPFTFVQGIARGSLRVFLWSADSFARITRRAPEYNTLRLDLTEAPPEEQDTSLRSLLHPQGPDLLSVLSLLRWAREDDQLQAVILSFSDFDIGWARLQSLRRSLLSLRQAGKQVWVYLAEGGMRAYYLASAADTIVMAPAGHLAVTGLAAEAMFFKGALDKLGIEAQVTQAGQYKAAGEPFTRESMSPAHREMMNTLLDDLYDQLVGDIAHDRRKTKAAVRRLIDQGLFLAREAMSEGLVDHIGYEDELPALLESRVNEKRSEERSETRFETKFIDAADYQRRRGRTIRRKLLKGKVPTIALITVDGPIKYGETNDRPESARAVGSTDFLEDLQHIDQRPDIAAVIVRISSPGGSGLGSDLIWHELRRLRTRLPLITSMGDVAASGGYYLAMAGDQVFAEEGTITGSIGVIAGKAVLQNLYTQLGIGKEILTRGKRAALLSDYQAFSPADCERMDLEIQAFYQDFLAKVAECRGLSVGSVELHAQGRVWSGRQAWARGLVDTLGGIEEAIAAVKERLALPVTAPIQIERFPKPSSLWRLPRLLRFLPRTGSSDLWWRRERVWAILPISVRFW